MITFWAAVTSGTGKTGYVPIGRNAAGEITGWFLYEDDPDLETLSDADRSRWPELAELADHGKELRKARQDAPEGPTGPG